MKIMKVKSQNEILPTYCMMCQKHIGGDDVGYGSEKSSHGVCKECTKQMMHDYFRTHRREEDIANSVCGVCKDPISGKDDHGLCEDCKEKFIDNLHNAEVDRKVYSPRVASFNQFLSLVNDFRMYVAKRLMTRCL